MIDKIELVDRIGSLWAEGMADNPFGLRCDEGPGQGGSALPDERRPTLQYVLEGSFQVEVGGEREVLGQGDCYFAEPHIMHGVVCLEDDSTLLDIFTPIREDFLK